MKLTIQLMDIIANNVVFNYQIVTNAKTLLLAFNATIIM